MSVHTIILTISMSLALVNCSKGGSGGGGGEGGEVTTAGTTGGVTSTGGGAKTSTTGQLVVDKGSPTATEVNTQQLNLPAGVKPAGPAVNVSESKNYNAGQIVIAIPYEAEKKSGLWASLTDSTDTSRIVVIYHVKNKDGSYTLGLVPNPELDFTDKLVSFTSRGPGNYQAAYLPEPVTKPITKTVDTPVLNPEEESALPTVVWSSLTGEVTAARKFKISGAISNSDVVLKRCVVIIDEDKTYPYDQAIYVSGSLTTEHVITKDVAHDLYGRLECQDNYGRSVTSAWTDKVSVPQAKYATATLSLTTGSVATDTYINNADKNSSDEWLAASFSDHVDVKYTGWLTAPIDYTCASSLDYSRSSHPAITDLPGEGVYWVCVKVTSVHSKVSYEHTPQLTKDTIAPSVDAGSDVVTNGTANLNATVSGAVAFTWAKNSGPGTITFGTPSAEDTTATASADGTYVLSLTATDAAGNSASDTVQLTKDSIAPTITFVSSAETDGMVNIADKTAGGSTPLFTISATGASSTKFSIWVSNATTCNSGVTYGASNIPKYSDLAGDFTNQKICARATDSAGNAAYASSAAISVDLTAPTASIINVLPAAPLTNQNTLYFQVSGTATTYEYSFTDQATSCAAIVSWTGPTPKATPTTSGVLSDGARRLCVRGLEASGNVSTIANYDWSIDATPPVRGNNGKIVINDLYYTSSQGTMSYAWDAATDNVSAQGTLQYDVYISTNGSLDADTVSSATWLTSHTGGSGVISKTQSTGLTDNGVLQYLYVRVMDGLGNKAIYTPRSFTVPNDTNKAFTQITLGDSTGCGLDQEGYAFCWGSNGSTASFLGIGTAGGAPQYIPQKVSGGKRYKKIAFGSNHACALDDNGAAYCWGTNTNGQLGDNTNTARNVSTAVDVSGIGNMKFKDIVTGGAFTCALGVNGSVYCWGSNSLGSLGDNTTLDSKIPVPTQIEGGATVKFRSIHVSAVQYSACAIAESGDLYCWGNNGYEQIADTASGNEILQAKPVNASGKKFTSVALTMNTMCALSVDGQVWCRGDNTDWQLGRNDTVSPTSNTLAYVRKQDNAPLSNIVAISASGKSEQFCAQNSSGEIACWGSNFSAPSPNGVMLGATESKYAYALPFSIGKVATQFVTNGQTACALDAEGDTHCWGVNTNKQAGKASGSPVSQTQLQLTAPRSVTRFASIATGAKHSCGITGQGKAHCWGDRANGKLGDNGATSGTAFEAVAVNAAATKFKQVAVGAEHSCALIDSGEAACWGDNAYSQLGYAGADSATPVVISGERFTQISLGDHHTCGLTAAGVVKCWGLNDDGQLGDGTTTNRTSPTAVAGAYISVAAGKSHTCALREDGQISCWGDNTYYQLAKTSGSLAPVVIDGGYYFAKLAVGANHGCGVRGDGTAMCWGDNSSSQVGNSASGSEIQAPFTVSVGSVRDIATGANHSCVVNSDHSLSCWGAGLKGQLGRGDLNNQSAMGAIIGPSYAKVRSIALGGNGSCAVMMDGASYCWGDDNLGQLGDMLGDAVQNSPSRVSEFFVP